MENKFISKLEHLNFFEKDFEKTINHILKDNGINGELVKTNDCGDFNYRQNMNLNLTMFEIINLKKLESKMKDCLNEYKFILNKGLK